MARNGWRQPIHWHAKAIDGRNHSPEKEPTEGVKRPRAKWEDGDRAIVGPGLLRMVR